MSGISFHYSPREGYVLCLPGYKVKRTNSFRGKHEFLVTSDDWEYGVSIVISFPCNRFIKDIAEVSVPLSSKKINVPVDHLGSVLKTMEVLAVI